MTLATTKRDPNGVVVNRAAFFVRDPQASSGPFQNAYRRLGGLGSFTLPAEAGSTTETALIEGTIASAAPAGVGNISGSVGALNAGPVHRLMEDKARSGGLIQCSIIRTAAAVETLSVAGSTTAANSHRVTIMGDDREKVKAAVRVGMLMAIAAAAPPAPAAVAGYAAARAAGVNSMWQGIMEVAADGSWFDVAPGFSAAIVVASGGSIVIRNPGRSYRNITGTVNQWDRGDHQAGANITSTFQIVPNAQLGAVEPEYRLDADIAYTEATGYAAG